MSEFDEHWLRYNLLEAACNVSFPPALAYSMLSFALLALLRTTRRQTPDISI
jgi:hypothetical protein